MIITTPTDIWLGTFEHCHRNQVWPTTDYQNTGSKMQVEMVWVCLPNGYQQSTIQTLMVTVRMTNWLEIQYAAPEQYLSSAVAGISFVSFQLINYFGIGSHLWLKSILSSLVIFLISCLESMTWYLGIRFVNLDCKERSKWVFDTLTHVPKSALPLVPYYIPLMYMTGL